MSDFDDNVIESDISQLTAKRGQVKARLTRLKTYFNSRHDRDIDIKQLKLRLSKFESACWDDFDQIQSRIETIDPSEIQVQERETFENAYFDLVSSIESYIQTSSETTGSQAPLPQTRVRLPLIQITPFDGNYDNWMTFYDTFTSLIDSDESLSEIQKFHYLRSLLRGEAFSLIQSIETSSINYRIAWNLLTERYQNKRIIIQKHISALFNLNSLHKESGVGLRQLTDEVVKHIGILKTLGIVIEHCDPFVIHLVCQRLDSSTNRAWETHIQTNLQCDFPSLENLLHFLKQRCHILESLDNHKPTETASSKSKVNFQSVKPRFTKVNINSHVVTSPNCTHCKQSHQLFACPQFLQLSISDRLQFVKQSKCCINCLKYGHMASRCRSSLCRICERKHNTLLHLDDDPNTRNNQITASLPQQPQPVSTNLMSHRTPSLASRVILATALVHVADVHGNHHLCRALLDCGSQASFISQSLCQKLNLRKFKTSVPVIGISQIQSHITHQCKVYLSSRTTSYSTTIHCLVLPKLNQTLPSVRFDPEDISLPGKVQLADPQYFIPDKIDLLLGADVFWEVLKHNKINLSNSLYIQESSLGWIISGILDKQIPLDDTYIDNNSLVCSLQCSTDEQLQIFWKIEDCFSESEMSGEERACEQFFVKNHFRDQEGRFVVSLPFKANPSRLGDSRTTAMNRFLLLERRLEKNPQLKSLYIDFMHEYKSLNHMELLPELSVGTTFPHYYLPHHPVLKDTQNGPKIRVVFDASCITSTGVSLNNILMTGPTIQQDIFSLLCRFRTHKFVMTADIVKMYRQVRVDEQSSHFQYILWRDNTNQKIQTFRLTTVTYGTCAAPFLAIRALQQLAHENKLHFPLAAQVLLTDVYVDDIITGSDSIVDLIQVRDELISCLQTGGFPLSKWSSNTQQTLRDLNPNDVEHGSFMIDSSNDSRKTLGVFWSPQQDNFQFTTHCVSKSITKRSVLSSIARLFDPLGLIGPIIIQFKIFMQAIWKLQLQWDEPLPPDMAQTWCQHLESLVLLEQISIPRFVHTTKTCTLEIHGFCDASESAYGACVYFKVNNLQGSNISLVASKSRVAPIKRITLPRLELCGAVLLSQLVNKIITSISVKIKEIHYWTDSMIVLSWLSAPSSKWKVFVATRVAKVQELTSNGTWHHVKSMDNPADCISRGISPSQLINKDHIWWSGPHWLSNNYVEDGNSQCESNNDPQYMHELVQACTAASVVSTTNSIFGRFSNFSKLRRVLAYCLRFIKNCKTEQVDRNHEKFVSVRELKESTFRLIQLAQTEAFHSELTCLSQGKSVNRHSSLFNLNPFIDQCKIIRAGGRIRNAQISADQKFPIILPPKHVLTKLILTHIHINQCHAGPQAVLATARLQYWPINAKRMIKSIIHNCIVCFKNKPVTASQLMGDLPAHRLQLSRPFLHCGVDFAGPIQILSSKLRKAKFVKSYIAIFVCFATKAVHIELVPDLSTDSFINSLKRFCSRRGCCSHIYSDNGTAFVGANNTLREFIHFFNKNQESLNHFLTEHSITWHFIPPRAPHFGGLWEAAVKSCKYHLKRILGNASLTFEEMTTVLCQIEACLNSRPLTPISSNPHDLSALTPAHFLIGDSLAALPEPDTTQLNTSRLSRFQRLQQLTQHFWRRWQSEYLSSLQPRTKNKQRQDNLRIDTLVLIREDGLPPTKWLLGRIMELHPGADGCVRVATVRTANGVFKRPITKLSPLPLDSQSSEIESFPFKAGGIC